MRKLSKAEWVAVFAAVAFTGYTLFGSSITALFTNKNQMDENSAAAINTGANTGAGVVINDLTPGTGAEVKQGDLVTVHYILSLSDGTVLQNSKDFGQPFQFVLGAGQVIKGWEQGFDGMKVGGTRTMTIPPELAYGSAQVGPIPPNSTLVFTVELLSAEAAPAQMVQ
mgnify:CR=1 FL=1